MKKGKSSLEKKSKEKTGRQDYATKTTKRHCLTFPLLC